MISLGQVALVTTIFAVVNTVVFTLLGMIAAILYNLAAKLVGGVTLTPERRVLRALDYEFELGGIVSVRRRCRPFSRYLFWVLRGLWWCVLS